MEARIMEEETPLPTRIGQIGAGFFLLFLFVTALFPLGTYVEFAARWQLLLALIAAMLVGAGIWGGWPLQRATIPAMLFGWLAVVAASYKYSGVFPFAGHEVLATILTGALGAIIVGSLAAWAAKHGSLGKANFAVWACGGATALLAFLLLDGLHQYFYRYPRALAELDVAGPLGEMERLIFEAMSGGRIGGRWGNPNVLAALILMLWPFGAALWSTVKVGWVRWSLAALLFGLAPGVLWSTGSRGGILCAVILAGFFGTAAMITQRRSDQPLLQIKVRRFEVIAGLILAVFLVIGIRSDPPGGKVSAVSKGGEDTTVASRFSRPSTITMRLGFLQAGLRMITEPAPQEALEAAPFSASVSGISVEPQVEIEIDAAPITTPNLLFGNGAGSYEHLSLLFQTPGRQESKYAHNWALQYLIEFGIVGLLAPVALILLATLFWFAGLKTPDSVNPGEGPPPSDDEPFDGAHLTRILPTASLLSALIFWINGGLEITPYLAEPFLLGAAAITIVFSFSATPKFLENRFFKILFVAAALFIGAIFFLHAPVQSALSRIAKLRQGPLLYLGAVANQQINPAEFNIKDFEGAARDIENSYLEMRESAAMKDDPAPFLLYADMHETVARVSFTDPTQHLYYARVALAEAAQRSPYSASVSARWARNETAPTKREALLRRAIALHPADPQYRAELAQVLHDNNPWDSPLQSESLDLLDQAIAREYRGDRIAAHEALKAEINDRLEKMENHPGS